MRLKWLIGAVAATAVLAGAGLVVWALGPEPAEVAAAPVPTPTRMSPSPSPSPSPTPSPSVAPTPSLEPDPVDEGCWKATGKHASRAEVRDALTTAANRQYWDTVKITVPLPLVKAIAWQESGWKSALVACDGGLGVMQVMPATADYLNGRFHVVYDPRTLDGNAALGVEYLAWLIRYFGQQLGTYDVMADDRLLDRVISAYQAGPGSVENGQTPPNQRYVDNVRALMASCPCQGF
ncbi:lytic transglycosylase domain-containing protein [Longispora sp. K20-0274]|uniref:lytic transglycosylase domain-containing protein n=1 Tax=Longispora sp. K20-0274 TaxID=3088255 RepID=UPI003999F04D